MWQVVETSTEGLIGTFGPFDTFNDALDFVNTTQFPWSPEYTDSVLIERLG